MDELGVQVGGERVVFGELAGDHPGGLRTQALGLVQRGEFGELQLRLLAQLPFLRVELGLLGVALAGHRHVFAEGHRHRARDQARDARGEQRAPLGGDPGDADDEPGDRHDAVVGAEHPGAQPVQPRPEARAVLLAGMVAGVGSLLGRPIGVHPVIGAWQAIRGALWRSEVGRIPLPRRGCPAHGGGVGAAAGSGKR